MNREGLPVEVLVTPSQTSDHVPAEALIERRGGRRHRGRYVALQRATGESRLFPDLAPGAPGTYSDAFSKWLARFLNKSSVTSPGAVFHSSRRGFKDRTLEAGLPSATINALGGWATAGQAVAYGSGFYIPTLAEHAAKISYPGLHLSRLVSAEGQNVAKHPLRGACIA